MGELIGSKSYSTHTGEGWGITYDGTNFLMFFSLPSDLTTPEQLVQIRKVRVIDPETDADVRHVNELEYVDGYVYANLWYKDKIIKIDPKTGYIVEEINMSSLYPINKRTKTADCLNGIAYDKTNGLFYVTGKLWPKLFAVLFKRTIT